MGDTTDHRLPTGFYSDDHDPLSSDIPAGFDPPHCPFVYPTIPKLTYKDIMGDSVKSLAEV